MYKESSYYIEDYVIRTSHTSRALLYFVILHVLMTYNIKIIRHNDYVIRVKVAQLAVLYVTRPSLALRARVGVATPD